MDFTLEELEILYKWYIAVVTQHTNDIEDDELAEKINIALENE